MSDTTAFGGAALSAEEEKYFATGGDESVLGSSEGKAPAPQAQEEDVARADAADPEAGGEDLDEGQRTVSHKALHAERERRKQAEKELAELREFRIRMEERARWAQEAQAERARAAQQQETAYEVPDPDQDIFGAAKHTLTQVEQLKHYLAQREEYERQQAQEQQVLSAYRMDAENYLKENPDFSNAYEHLYQSRLREMKRMYPQANETQLRNAIMQEEKGLVVEALQRGMRPTQLLYEIAQDRGYVPRAKAGVEEPSLEEKKEEARTRSRTLSGQGGNPTGPMTAERLSKMSMDEFKAYEKRHPEIVTKLMMQA